MTNTIKFVNFPFTHKGIHFNSKVSEYSSSLPTIMEIGEAFIKMNQDAIDELLPMLADLSLEEIQDSLDVLNEGGTEMFLEIGDETLAGAR